MSPPDDTLLSSSGGTEGSVVSLAYMGVGAEKHARVVALFRRVEALQRELCGK